MEEYWKGYHNPVSILEDKKHFKCFICENNYSSKQYLNIHIERVHEKKKQLFGCLICKNYFHKKSNLNQHRKRVHEKTCIYFHYIKINLLNSKKNMLLYTEFG
jgi:hypothetical protein